MSLPSSDLPPYTVRESDRARKVRLTVTARDGLVVVVPRRFPAKRVPLIVAMRRGWAERALERVRERREALIAGRRERPQSIELPGIGEAWDVVYRSGSGPAVRATAAVGRIVLAGPVEDAEACRAALLRFCRRRAAAALPPMLERLSAEEGLPYARVSVRGQRTRWGSCSSGGTISLNFSLAFLPPRLVRHVMLHELVHTRRLDHSPAFRRLLAEREPDAEMLAAELRAAWRHVPGWALDG